MASTETAKLKTKAKASLTLLLVAVISITTATYAWFTMSNSTTVQNMEVQVGTGAKLEVSTYNGGYDAVLTNDDIKAAMNAATAANGWDFGYKNGIMDIHLWPLSSGDGINLYTQTANGTDKGTPTGPKKGYYLELPLWFLASTNMNVYLNSEGFAGEPDTGTLVTAVKSKIKDGASKPDTTKPGDTHKAMRVSFTPTDMNDIDANLTTLVPAIYEPEKETTGVVLNGEAKKKIPSATTDKANQTTFKELGTNAGVGGTNTTPILFGLAKNTPKQVTIRIWIEGEDKQCVNLTGTNEINIEKEFLTVRLRFCGADKDGNYIEADQE